MVGLGVFLLGAPSGGVKDGCCLSQIVNKVIVDGLDLSALKQLKKP